MMKMIALLIYLLAGNAYAQTISGSVVDESSGKPIPYAHLWIQATTLGTYSSSTGLFQLEIPENAGDSLVFSCIGYETQTVAVQDISSEELIVTLKSKPILLDKVEVSTSH